MESTQDDSYAERLRRLEGARWKQVLNIQAPYQWNLRRKDLGRTLDVGCGIGRNLAALPDGVGLDHNGASVATARERGFTAWTTDEWQDSPDARPASFDSMLLAHVLEHMQTTEGRAVISRYLPYLKPHARIVVICPQEAGYRTDATHVQFVDDAEIAATLHHFDFRVVSSRSFPFPRPAGKLFPYNEFVVVGRR